MCIAGKEGVSNSPASPVNPLHSAVGSVVPPAAVHQPQASPGDSSVVANNLTGATSVSVGGTTGVSTSQLYLLDSSYDLDLDSIDGSVSQPSHSESSQLGLIHNNAV